MKAGEGRKILLEHEGEGGEPCEGIYESALPFFILFLNLMCITIRILSS